MPPAPSFAYISHEGSGPASFILQSQAAHSIISPDAANAEAFEPTNVQDARERISRTIAQRRGQRAFRDLLIAAYNGRCAITGCSVLDVLEAAHIYPYRGPDTNKVSNGLLLRADLHTLFDCGLIAVDAATMTVLIAPRLRNSGYRSLHGRRLRPTQSWGQQPSKEALNMHREAAGIG